MLFTIAKTDNFQRKPCLRGMRITVYDVLGYMAAGISHQEILTDFPSLTETDLLAATDDQV